MNQLDREAYVSIDKNYDLYDEVYNSLDGVAITIKSVTGLEVATFIVAFSELIVLILSMPVIQDAFNSGHIIVMIGGVKFNDTVRGIIKEVKKDPNLMKEVITAYSDDTITIEGKAKAVQSFKKKLQNVIDKMET